MNPRAAHSLWPAAVAGVLLAAVTLLYLMAPMSGDFQYSDASRHALNGAFFLDLLHRHPMNDPAGWAAAYYLKYPALTILFYPPLFHLVEAGMFAVFGVSHGAAQLTVSVFVLAGAFAAYDIARRVLSPPASLAAAILFVWIPVAAYWGRQVMLDLPAVSVMLCGVAAVLRYVETRRVAWLIAGTVILGLALYIKQTVVFIAAPLLLVLFQQGLLMRKATLWAAALLILELAPLAVITLKFGQFNAVSVAEEPAAGHLPSWLFYIGALPRQLGWPLTVCLVAIPAAIFTKWRPPRYMAVLLTSWIAAGLIVFSAIGLKSDRFDLPALFPLVVLTLAALEHLISRAAMAAAAPLLGAATVAWSIFLAPVPTVGGYNEAAKLVVSDAPRGSAVLLSAKHDGSFIFDVRALAPLRHDLSIVRSDKLFLEMAVAPRYGVKTLRDFSDDEIAAALSDLGISYVVAQDDFMVDQPVMKRLQRVLESERFVKVATIPVTATVYGADENFITIYRSVLKPGAGHHGDLEISLPIVGRKISLDNANTISETVGCLFCARRPAVTPANAAERPGRPPEPPPPPAEEARAVDSPSR